MPESSTLALFFSTTATLATTLTGLIGAFSTLRLQNICNELLHIIETIRIRRTPAGALGECIKRSGYGRIGQIYDNRPRSPHCASVSIGQEWPDQASYRLCV